MSGVSRVVHDIGKGIGQASPLARRALQSVRGGARVQQTSKHCTELWKRQPLGVACAVGRRQPGLLHVRATTQPW